MRFRSLCVKRLKASDKYDGLRFCVALRLVAPLAPLLLLLRRLPDGIGDGVGVLATRRRRGSFCATLCPAGVVNRGRAAGGGGLVLGGVLGVRR